MVFQPGPLDILGLALHRDIATTIVIAKRPSVIGRSREAMNSLVLVEFELAVLAPEPLLAAKLIAKVRFACGESVNDCCETLDW